MSYRMSAEKAAQIADKYIPRLKVQAKQDALEKSVYDKGQQRGIILAASEAHAHNCGSQVFKAILSLVGVPTLKDLKKLIKDFDFGEFDKRHLLEGWEESK